MSGQRYTPESKNEAV